MELVAIEVNDDLDEQEVDLEQFDAIEQVDGDDQEGGGDVEEQREDRQVEFPEPEVSSSWRNILTTL